MGKVEDQIVSLLKSSSSPLSFAEITSQLGKSPKAIFKSLRKLFEEGKIDCDIKTRRYTLVKE